MLIGLFLKNYKAYKGNIFIPLTTDRLDNLSIIVGKNGVGKSTILEALDTFFNGEPFSIYNGASKKDSYVAPLFLFEKTKLDYTIKYTKNLAGISDFLWSYDNTTLRQYKNIQEFFKMRDTLKASIKIDDYFLFVLDVVSDLSKKIEFGPFKNEIYKNAYLANVSRYKGPKGKISVSQRREQFDKKYEKEVLELRKKVNKEFNYVYIPVEASISNFLKLETEGMQRLMKQDILKSISNIISQKININGQNSNVEAHLNKQLETFIEEIEEQIKVINPGYNFKVETGWKRLTAANIRDKIVETYLSKRELKLEKQSIRELSSGERRKSLIDIAYAFLSGHSKAKKEKITILAIDEPEASLNISLMFEQFYRIQELADNPFNQIFITTHWYGSLPLIQKGNLLNITKISGQLPKIHQYHFFDYFGSKKKYFLDEISLKSYFDLTSSVFSSIISRKQNWLFCEGPDDKNYLEYYLKDKIDELRIICAGGCSHLIKIYKYLLTPVNEEYSASTAQKLIKGKVFFLLDTDRQQTQLGSESNSKFDIVQIRRLQTSKDVIELYPIDGNNPYTETEMEDSLIPSQFYTALINTITKYGDEETKKAIKGFSFNKEAIFSTLKGENSVLLVKEVSHQIKNKQKVISFLENHQNKFYLADEYCKISKEKEPGWIDKIVKFFNEK